VWEQGCEGGLRPVPEDDPTQRQPDITRARELLHWSPTVELREGLTRTIAYFRERMPRNLPEVLKELSHRRDGAQASPSGEVQAVRAADWTSLV
jgi:hypothetical protein